MTGLIRLKYVLCLLVSRRCAGCERDFELTSTIWLSPGRCGESGSGNNVSWEGEGINTGQTALSPASQLRVR
jgi:hypothetical protein